MYLKHIYFILSILQIYCHIYVLNKMPCNCTFSILKSAKLEQLIFCLMNFNCAEVVLKSSILRIFDCAKVELLQVYFRYTLNILHYCCIHVLSELS